MLRKRLREGSGSAGGGPRGSPSVASSSDPPCVPLCRPGSASPGDSERFSNPAKESLVISPETKTCAPLLEAVVGNARGAGSRSFPDARRPSALRGQPGSAAGDWVRCRAANRAMRRSAGTVPAASGQAGAGLGRERRAGAAARDALSMTGQVFGRDSVARSQFGHFRGQGALGPPATLPVRGTNGNERRRRAPETPAKRRGRVCTSRAGCVSWPGRAPTDRRRTP